MGSMYITRNKYRNNRCEYQGMFFDSQKELERWIILTYDQRAGKISNLRRQVKYELLPSQKTKNGTLRPVYYIADFVYTENGNEIVEDAKGIRTDAYIIKKKLMYERYGILILET